MHTLSRSIDTEQFSCGARKDPLPRLFSSVVEHIGTHHFSERVMQFLNAGCGAGMCFSFSLQGAHFSPVSVGRVARVHLGATIDRYAREHWCVDPVLNHARRCLPRHSATVVRAELTECSDRQLRQSVYPYIQDRLLLWGVRQDREIGISVVATHTNTRFSMAHIGWLEDWSDVLLAALASHAANVGERANAAVPLSDLAELERGLVVWGLMPRREVEVCARILYGMSTLGISLGLGLSEESVKTYRKRAYQRLHIGCQRELLQWYLELWKGGLLGQPLYGRLPDREDVFDA